MTLKIFFCPHYPTTLLTLVIIVVLTNGSTLKDTELTVRSLVKVCYRYVYWSISQSLEYIALKRHSLRGRLETGT